MEVKYSDIWIQNSANKIEVRIDEVDHCPMCKHAIRPTKIYGKVFFNNSNKLKLSIIYCCNHCFDTFIAQYSNKDYRSSSTCYSFANLDFLAPDKFEETIFEDSIKSVSPMFVKIYNQASEAEHHNLDEVAGIGYRKALEFLIKDFLIYQHPDKEESIKETLLGTCINNFIDNPQLKQVAARAVWLGNDQTHYIQKFEDKDINDLKLLITLTTHWITLLYLTEQSINDIEKP